MGFITKKNTLNLNQKKIGAILSYIQLLSGVLFTLLITPILLGKIGKSEFGIISVSKSLISYLNLITLGIGSAFLRFNIKYRVNNDKIGENKLNGTFMYIYLFMSILMLLAGALLFFVVPKLFGNEFTLKEIRKTQIIIIISTIEMAISLPLSIYKMNINAYEKFIFAKIIGCVTTILNPLIKLPVVFFGGLSVEIVIFTSILNILLNIIIMIYAKSKLKVKCKFGKPVKGILKKIFAFSIFILIGQVVDIINWNVDNIIIGNMLGTKSVAVYTIAATFNTYFLSFIGVFIVLFAPQVYKNQSEHDGKFACKENSLLMIKVGKIQGFLSMLIFLGYVAIGNQFINLWVGPSYKDAYIAALCLISPLVLSSMYSLGIEIRRTVNKHQYSSLFMIVVSCINIGLTVLFINYFGIIGAALGTLISHIVNLTFITFYYNFYVGIDMKLYFKKIIRFSFGWIIPLGVAIGLSYVKLNLWQFILCGIAFVIVYVVSVYLFSINKQERIFINSKIKKLVEK